MAKKDKDKTGQAREMKSKAEMAEDLNEDWMTKEQLIAMKKYFTYKRIFIPAEMLGGNSKKICDRTLPLKMAMRDPELHDELMSEILGDLITGAYQNKLETYSISLCEDSKGSTDAMRTLQKLRQSADMHLLNIIKTIRDIKRPPVQVIVKQAEQVNVGEQINQGDQQVNTAKNTQIPK